MKKEDISKVGKKLLIEKGFRFGVRQEVYRSLEHAKLNSNFLKWLDKKSQCLLIQEGMLNKLHFLVLLDFG